MAFYGLGRMADSPALTGLISRPSSFRPKRQLTDCRGLWLRGRTAIFGLAQTPECCAFRAQRWISSAVYPRLFTIRDPELATRSTFCTSGAMESFGQARKGEFIGSSGARSRLSFRMYRFRGSRKLRA